MMATSAGKIDRYTKKIPEIKEDSFSQDGLAIPTFCLSLYPQRAVLFLRDLVNQTFELGTLRFPLHSKSAAFSILQSAALEHV